MSLGGKIKSLMNVDLFEEGKNEDWFVGRPFHIDYGAAHLLISDSWKKKVKGIPKGTFLLGFYENEKEVQECLLLRALEPTELPTDGDIIRSMIEYYKNDIETNGENSKLDPFTEFEFSFSGLECRVLGTFYKDSENKIKFGADVENFYSAHNYKVYKPMGDVLELIINFKENNKMPGIDNDERIGKVRYSSTMRFQDDISDVSVYVSPKDFLGKRTALFGMTRTGKSNTAKKIIEATCEISDKAKQQLDNFSLDNPEENLTSFDEDENPKYPVGQIIFDVNGEYANSNMQDEGTAIFDLYKDRTERYSILEKKGFNVMKVNFYNEIQSGFNLICDHFKENKDKTDYVQNFMSVNLEKPKEYENDYSAKTRYDRIKAAYLCCLYKANFKVPEGLKVKFKGIKEINKKVRKDNPINPDQRGGITLKEASIWFERVWKNYNEWDYFVNYPDRKGHEWADEDLKALLAFLTRNKEPGSSRKVSGYIKLRPLTNYHTSQSASSFEENIIEQLREGKIIIVDLSQGNPEIKKLYSQKICEEIFSDAMNRFINNKPNNIIQFYFEEAHNLFPKKDDKDLSDVYNRIAKEGAKLNLGLIYATQEVSSISSNILKNTQNWFVSHLNNDEELRELKKYYDFADFVDGLTKFSASTDQGYIRMKTYSNPFTVPVQIDRFIAEEKEEN